MFRPLFWVIIRSQGHVPVEVDVVNVNRHDRTIFVILAKHCTSLPDDGSSVIRKNVGALLNIL